MDYYCRQYLLQYKDQTVKHTIDTKRNKCMVLIENRLSQWLTLVIKNFCIVNNDWNLYIFSTEEIFNNLSEELPDVEYNKKYLSNDFEITHYNKLLLSAQFWNDIKEEHVMIFQLDTLCIRQPTEKQLQYDYIGAVCGSDCNETTFIINGDLSLRNRSIMLEVCNKIQYDGNTNEDVVLTNYLRYNGYNIPSMDECNNFSYEGSGNIDTCIGFHGINKTHYNKEKYTKLHKLIKYKKIKVYIGTPCFGAQCSSNYTLSLINTLELLKQVNIEYQIGFCNNQLTLRARNILTYEFLKSDCTHLLWIDADIEFQPEYVLQLLTNNLSICIGLYPNKCYQPKRLENIKDINSNNVFYKMTEYSTRFIVDERGNQKVFDNNYIEVKYGATGFMKIDRDVIEKLITKVPKYTTNGKVEIHDLWNCKVVDRDYLTEDYYFCYLWQHHFNGKIYADLDINLNHEGWQSYRGNPFLSFN